MKQKEYKVLGHKVRYNVTETSQEFNALDPSRPDAANDEAVANIVYRSMNPETRYTFLHGRDAVEAKDGQPAVAGITGVEEETGIDRKTEVVTGKDGKPRTREGVEVTRFVEAEEVFYNRVIATLVEQKKYASEDAARAHFQPLIEQIALEVPFDITAPERAERGPKKLAAKYKLAAAKVLALDNTSAVNSNQLAKIGKTFVATGDTTKMFTGTYPSDAGDVSFSVSDKDAEALGWLIKEYLDWKAAQVMQSEF